MLPPETSDEDRSMIWAGVIIGFLWLAFCIWGWAYTSYAKGADPDEYIPGSWTAQTPLKAGPVEVQEFKDGAIGWVIYLEVKKADFPNGQVPTQFDVIVTIPDPENYDWQGDVFIDGKDDQRYGLSHLQNAEMPHAILAGHGDVDFPRGSRPPPNRDFQIRILLIPRMEGMGKPTIEATAFSHPNNRGGNDGCNKKEKAD